MSMKIPQGWAISNLGSIATYINGRAFKPTEWETTGLPIIRIQNLNNPNAFYNYTNHQFEEKYKVKKGDLLFAWSASLGTYIWKNEDAWLNQHIFKVIPHKGINKSFLFYLLTHITNELYAKAHGSGMVHVTKRVFDANPILLPPLKQQIRIIQKIEELFSEIDDGIESLEMAKEQLNVYREAILIQAFEGKLTQEWRNANIDILKNSHSLIESIHKSQESEFNNLFLIWKTKIKDWEKSEKTDRKIAKPAKPKAFEAITEEIKRKHSLPPYWALFRLGNLFSVSPQNGLYKAADQYNDYATRIIRIDSFYDGKITEVDNLKRLNLTNDELKTYQLNENDLIINRVNSIEYLGKCAFVSKLNVNEPTVFESNIMRCKLLQNVSPKYIAYYLSSIKGKDSLCLNAKHAVNQASINQTDVGNAIIPLPNYLEQIQIVELIEDNFEKIQTLEAEISNNLVKLIKFKTSILAKAFSGELIPQDPNDEPASVLLERIKAEKEKELAKEKAKKAPKKLRKPKTQNTEKDKPAQQELI
ncbi:restriction endonuclease subunit S [Acinetobacter pittii]|uniref:restriction endonuclease subunit S n=1 Tax=Acinetobacter pittii TaxID=48296 RepID=UPI0026EFDEA5|nr:restriction endonuclease subunit S [Acinetobacter pittii]MDO7196036.1 restriction endonuclease subunit S [Acinetobacter pittii]